MNPCCLAFSISSGVTASSEPTARSSSSTSTRSLDRVEEPRVDLRPRVDVLDASSRP